MIVVQKNSSTGYRCYNFKTKEEAISYLRQNAKTEVTEESLFNDEYTAWDGGVYCVYESGLPVESDEFCGLPVESDFDDYHDVEPNTSIDL